MTETFALTYLLQNTQPAVFCSERVLRVTVYFILKNQGRSERTYQVAVLHNGSNALLCCAETHHYKPAQDNGHPYPNFRPYTLIVLCI